MSDTPSEDVEVERECDDPEGHEWREYSYRYGEDADGNRGVTLYGKHCIKCGEEK